MIETDLEPAMVLRIPERETSDSPWSMCCIPSVMLEVRYAGVDRAAGS